MAHIVPSDLSTLALAGAHGPELRTLAYLQRALPDGYTVFHGVHWTREYQGYTVYGEIDFAILNQAGEVLVIEQKNGALEETAEGLVKTYRSGPKNVGSQVHRSLDNLRDKFRESNGAGGRRRRLRLNYLIYCPDHRLESVNAAGLDRDRVVDAAGRELLAERIQALMPPGEAHDPNWTAAVERFLSQSFEVVPDVHAHIEAGERAFTRLSGGLARTIADIDMHPMRLRVRGTAGCGKSIVAREGFLRAIDCGYRPLLVCFNRLLAERLKALVGETEGMITTFHGLCDAFLTARGHRLDYSGVRTDPAFWPRIQERVMAEPVPDAWRFDTLILDEGQDFAPEWAAIVQRFLVADADVLWLEDRDQDLYGTEAVDLPGFVTFNARCNHRSPESIARFIARTLPFRFECANDLPGLGVGVARYDVAEQQHALAATAIERLLDRGFPADAITVLTSASRADSAFDGVTAIGDLPVRRFANAYDAQGNQVMTEGRIAFESINRFKGQQAPAVIVTDVEPGRRGNGVALQRDLRRLFCAMTRATVRLEILTRADNPLTAGWESDES